MFGFLRNRRRRRLRARPFPPEWLDIVRGNVPFFACLSEPDRQQLLGHVQVFLAEKRFEGCGGLVMTDEIRVTVAAQACLLLLHRQADYYPRLVSILVYPTAYMSEERRMTRAGVMTEGHTVRLGESWDRAGAVVLSWDGVRVGGADARQGQNVVLHEFAHQLDSKEGLTDAVSMLEESGSEPRLRTRYLAWARTLSREYERLKRDAETGRPTVLSTYGATNPAEFFAVATETFFENPRELRKKHPQLYDELGAFYAQDPAAWRSPERTGLS